MCTRIWVYVYITENLVWNPEVGVTINVIGIAFAKINPPASEASEEVANLTERKNPHTPAQGVKEFVCLSVTNFDSNDLRTGKTEWAEIMQNLCVFLKIW